MQEPQVSVSPATVAPDLSISRWRPQTSASVAAVATFAALFAALLALASFALALANRDLDISAQVLEPPSFHGTQQGVSALVFALPGWYLATRRPRLPFGWLLLVGAISHGLSGTGWGYFVASEIGGGHYPAPWLGPWFLTWATGVEVPVIAAIFVLYPEAERPRGWIGILGITCLAVTVIGTMLGLVAPFGDFAVDPAAPIARVTNPFELPIPELPGGGVLWYAPPMLILTALLLVRWYQATGERKQLIGWLAVGNLSGVLFIPVGVLGGGAGFLLSVQLPSLLLIAALTTATLRHRVYGIDIVVSRAFRYVALATVVGAIYAATVGVGVLIAGNVNQGISFAAAMLAAFALAPARSRVDSLVNRFLFGERDEPYRVLSRVAERLEVASSEQLLLSQFTDEVAAALRLPYAAVALHGESGTRVIEHGKRPAAVATFPISQQGVQTGALITGLRSGERAFSAAESRLLEDLARQASGAIANLSLAEDLSRSRERIVTAREEERRRLRHDLHDGLGPVLTGTGMLIDVARKVISSEPAAADERLREAREQVSDAINEVRRVVYGLRPPALDELGLVGAIRSQPHGALDVTVDADDPFPPLPAAIEVAAFRIISEAITNAARHSGASRCVVTINVGREFEVTITDDGDAGEAWHPGVGITSMRERAGELGGTLTAGPGADGHGRVQARIPIGART